MILNLLGVVITPLLILFYAHVPAEEPNVTIEFTDSGVRITPNVGVDLPSSILYTLHDQSLFLPYALDDETTADLMMGISLYSAGDCENARQYLTPINVQEIDRITSFYAGNCALVMNDYASALELFSADYPLATPSSINLWWTHIQINPTEPFEGLMVCPRIEGWICTPQERVDKLTRIAQLYALGFDYAQAVSTINSAITFVERYTPFVSRLDAPPHLFTSNEVAALYTQRGQFHLLLYEWDNVLADYNNALELAPDYADAYFYRGLLYYSALTDQIPRETALADFIRYLELAPSGSHAAEAEHYITIIQAEMDALDS
jgi:tetratricopeptide (TPR) repeat protein